MYRKIALTSVALNVAFVFVTLFAFVPWFIGMAKDLKIELPMPLIWLIEASSFVRSPVGLVSTILLLGFFGVKAFRKGRAAAV